MVGRKRNLLEMLWFSKCILSDHLDISHLCAAINLLVMVRAICQ